MYRRLCLNLFNYSETAFRHFKTRTVSFWCSLYVTGYVNPRRRCSVWNETLHPRKAIKNKTCEQEAMEFVRRIGVVCAMAEAVSRWLPTASARVQSRVWSSGICGVQSGVTAGFLRVLRFPLPFIPPNSPSSQSPGAGTIGQ
jgi:hypothetical protein